MIKLSLLLLCRCQSGCLCRSCSLGCFLYGRGYSQRDSYWQRGCANSGPWILIGTAALRIVVGGFLIRTAVKIVTRCVFLFFIFLLVASVHSLF